MTEIKKTVEVDQGLINRFGDTPIEKKPITADKVPESKQIIKVEDDEDEKFEEVEEDDEEEEEEEEKSPKKSKKKQMLEEFKKFMEEKKNTEPKELESNLPGFVLLTGLVGFGIMIAKGFIGAGKSQ